MAFGTVSADLIQTSTGQSLGAGNSVSMVNRIINSRMEIDQRNAGASVTPTTANTTYSVDRYNFLVAQNSKFTAQQNAGSVTPPTGFTNYLGVTSSSAYTVGAAEFFSIQQSIEGFNTADLDFGKSTAKTITLSFQVYSSLTGTFGGSLRNSDSSRSYPFSYSIPIANTWTSISITIAGDTSGTWLTTNGIGIKVGFSLGAGSTYSGTAGSWSANNYFTATGATSVVGTNGATFYITGVDLRLGEYATAPSPDFRSYGQELALCQRYYYKNFPGIVNKFFAFAGASNTGFATGAVIFPVVMRDIPTALEQVGTANNYLVNVFSGGITCTSVPIFVSSYTTTTTGGVSFPVSSGLTIGQFGTLRTDPTNGAGAYLAWSAEL